MLISSGIGSCVCPAWLVKVGGASPFLYLAHLEAGILLDMHMQIEEVASLEPECLGSELRSPHVWLGMILSPENLALFLDTESRRHGRIPLDGIVIILRCSCNNKLVNLPPQSIKHPACPGTNQLVASLSVLSFPPSSSLSLGVSYPSAPPVHGAAPPSYSAPRPATPSLPFVPPRPC